MSSGEIDPPEGFPPPPDFGPLLAMFKHVPSAPVPTTPPHSPPSRRMANPRPRQKRRFRIDLTIDSSDDDVSIAPVPVVPVVPVVAAVPVTAVPLRDCPICRTGLCFWRRNPSLLPIPPHIMALNKKMDEAKRAWVRAKWDVIIAEIKWEQDQGY